MTHSLAKEVLKQLEAEHGPILTLDQVMDMAILPSILQDDHLAVYAFQTGNITVLVRILRSPQIIKIKTIEW